MDDLTASAKPRLRPLLDHFSKIEDMRQLRRVVYQLREIPFLVVCGTIASGDDYDDIVDSGAANWGFLRGISDVLCERLPRGRKCGELPHRPRRRKHGRGPPLRPQSGAPSRRKTIHQATPQAGRLGSHTSAADIRAVAMLIWTRSPGIRGHPQAGNGSVKVTHYPTSTEVATSTEVESVSAGSH